MGKSAIPTNAARMTAAVCLFLMLLLGVGGSAAAQQTCADEGCIDVVAVDGLIDEIEATNIIDAVERADRGPDVLAVVLQMDSEGTAVSAERLTEVAMVIEESSVPVSVWIGPSGAVALGGAAELVAIADSSGIAPGAEIGSVGAQRLPIEQFGELFTGEAAVAENLTLEGEAAVEAGLVDRFAPIVREHIVNIEGVPSEVSEVDGESARTPSALVRFSKLPLGTQFLHTMASPSVAYLLLVVGLGLLVFEFYTAGIGIAGVVGAGCVVFAGYGVAALPHNTWALVLVVASAVGFSVDIQSGVPRVWTAISMLGFTVGSVFLFTEFAPTWLALLAGMVGMAAAMFSGMPSMVRARFGTPTIGRDWMIGEPGVAVDALDPEGSVRVRGALWRARTNRTTSIPAERGIRVAGIDGVTLEVEPLEGVEVEEP